MAAADIALRDNGSSAGDIALASGAGSQSLTPSLVTNSQSFYGPTITTGPVTLAPSLATNSQTFPAPTVAPGAVTLAPSLLTNSEAFYSPTVTAGAVALLPSLLTNAQTFYGPVVTQAGGTQYILPDLFTNEQQFFAAVVSQPSQAADQPSGGWPEFVRYKPRKQYEEDSETEKVEAQPAEPVLNQPEILRAKRRADRVMAELKAIYAEQDAIQASIQAKLASNMEEADEDSETLALLLALM